MDPHFFLAGRSYHQPAHPVTDELLAEFERTWGVRLPDSYVELLRIQNGGQPRRRLFISAGESEHVFAELAGIGPEQLGGRDLLESVGEWTGQDVEGNESEMSIPRTVIPFCGDGHNYLALDYRDCGPARVPAVVSVCCEETPLMYFPVASSFDAFVAGLVRDDTSYYFGFCGVEDDAKTLIQWRSQI